MNVSLPAATSSFTALLELPPTQVVKLLDDPAQCHTPPPPPHHHDLLLEVEPPPVPNHHSISAPPVQIETQKPVKRKLPHKINKNKIKEEEEEEEEVTGASKRKKSKKEQDQLPYVHVRARRGQATDSHSLAERARREKINARMKLLQELVPGCSKITGIALVLDEIINHVQALQCQVEFLSMQLAAVHPRVEFNLDQFLDENTYFVDDNFLSMHPPLEWSEPQASGFRRSFVQKWECDAYQQPQWLKEENNLESVTTPDTTDLRTDYSQEPGCMQPMQLKVEQA